VGGYQLKLVFRADVLSGAVVDVDVAVAIGRVGRRVIGGCGLDVLLQKGHLAERHDRVIPHRPLDERVGQANDRARRAAGGVQWHLLDVAPPQEFPQEARIGCGEGGVDGLVGIANAHPVMLRAEQAQHVFLELAAVLSLIFQDERPAIPKAGQVVAIPIQGVDGQAHQIVKIDPATVAQAALVVLVDRQPKAGQRQLIRSPFQELAHLWGIQPVVFGLFDET